MRQDSKSLTGAAEVSVRQRNKADEISWDFDCSFSGARLSRFWCMKTCSISLPYTMVSAIDVHDCMKRHADHAGM